MKYIKLKSGEIIEVSHFEEKTNNDASYFKYEGKFALCPTCGSSVHIIGGYNNKTQQVNRAHYAAHTQNKIEGLNFDQNAKNECPNYDGNNRNWQKIYKKSESNNINHEAEKFIEENKNKIASEIEDIIGFKCVFKSGPGKLFSNLYKKFKERGGLYIPSNEFIPEYISRLMIEKAGQINLWGYMPTIKTESLIRNRDELSKYLDSKQFKPPRGYCLVGVLDNDSDPKRIIIKIVYEDNELQINSISAKTKN